MSDVALSLSPATPLPPPSPPAPPPPPSPPLPPQTARRSTRALSIRQHINLAAAAAGKRKPRAKKAAKKTETKTKTTTTTAPTPPPNVDQRLVDILELAKAHYAGDGIEKGLKKGLHTMKNSGDCPCGKHDSAAAHHFTARGDIDMHSELRGEDIWGREKALGLEIGFFEKHNKNKSKKRKASVMDDDDDADAAADDVGPPREVTGGAAVDRYMMPALEDLTTGQWLLRVTRLEIRCGSLAALLIMNGVKVPQDLLSVSSIPWTD